jgi:DNA-binding GntR family transcriptional regulator
MKISEKEISEMLGVSRTPVRETFIKLANEKLLEILPQRGTIISQIDLTQVAEARFIRENLEGAVMKLATEEFPESHIRTMDANLQQQRFCVQEKDYRRFFELDEEFHKAIFFGCGKTRTWEVVQMLNTQYARIRVLSLMHEINYDQLLDQHNRILNAIKEKDASLGQQITAKHLKKLLIDQEELRKKYPDYFI